ncbi:hypothetical protein MUCCIDRAFT_36429, partial [Mucor lusitanicus CBS 277.49]
VAVGIAMLVTARGESCDQPLQTFIIVYMVRTVISCPFYIGQHFERAEERLPELNACCRLRSLVDLFAVLWFIVGNYLLFSSKTCSALAPRLYYTSLAYVLIGYLVVIVPILLCTSAIFCLPCVMCKLIFFIERNPKLISSSHNAMCCICLAEYEDQDLLCRLWCGHHFHKSCLTEWLALNKKCPLCKQDFRGKEYQEDSQDEDEPDDDGSLEMQQLHTATTHAHRS